jgi:hypothetical protein
MPQITWVPFVGVIVGFILSQIANVISWFLSSRREKQLVRLLLALEIEQNLSLLNDYWHNVSLPPDEEEELSAPKEIEVEADRLARRAVLIPLPILSDRAFASQLAVLPKALNQTAIHLTWRVYEEIAQVKALHAWLLEIASEPPSKSDSFPSASRAIRSAGILSATFKTKKSSAIYDLRITIQRLLNEGNPLNKSNPSFKRDALERTP